ncbi:MAG: amidohydrolase family protein [Tatlockia sp.]|jgi:hypothetical protein
MKKVDLEAHFYTRSVFEYLAQRIHYPKAIRVTSSELFNVYFSETVSLFHNEAFIDTLCDIASQRIAAMDAAGLDQQVLSFSTPSIDELHPDNQKAIELAIEMNDLIYTATQNYPNRFKGFATIAIGDIPAATCELERCIQDLKFVGWLTHSNFGKQNYLDAKKYWPLFEIAEAMNIPIYIHPTIPLMTEFTEYGFSLAGPPMGFQFDTALCLLRMIYNGVFNQFPKLKIILGHLGEALPILMPDRIDWAYKNKGIANNTYFAQSRPRLNKTPSEIILDNVYMTTSGRFSKAALDFTLNLMGKNRVLFASDYPYENLQDSVQFIDGCGYSETIRKQIYYSNAQALGIVQ